MVGLRFKAKPLNLLRRLMHPNTYLRTFWRLITRPVVFVAMAFDDAGRRRYDHIIKPAIEGITWGAQALKAYRVDESRSGDSIITDINDGIAHSRFVLVDVTTIGYLNDMPMRNGNVMYELGIALACRHPSDVLIIRGDNDRLLFDVTTIPHKQIDFSDEAKSAKELQAELVERMREQKRLLDARLDIALASLTHEELTVIQLFGDKSLNDGWNFGYSTSVNFTANVAFPRLLDKGAVRIVGKFKEGHPTFAWTEMGLALARRARELKVVSADAPQEAVQAKAASDGPS
jgi:hypothetical protein